MHHGDPEWFSKLDDHNQQITLGYLYWKHGLVEQPERKAAPRPRAGGSFRVRTSSGTQAMDDHQRAVCAPHVDMYKRKEMERAGSTKSGLKFWFS